MRFVEWNIIFTVRIRSTYFRSTAANQLPSVQCSMKTVVWAFLFWLKLRRFELCLKNTQKWPVERIMFIKQISHSEINQSLIFVHNTFTEVNNTW